MSVVSKPFYFFHIFANRDCFIIFQSFFNKINSKFKNMFNPTEYKIMSVATGNVCDDCGWQLDFQGEEKPSLIRAIYSNKQLDVKEDHNGLYCYSDWLPVKNILKCDSKPITYKSKALADKLGLKNLYITFNGYFPEIGANMRTCSFKETEAYSICARLNEEKRKEVVVVSSAGNTARAFAQVCSDNNINLLLTIPEDNLDALWFEKPLNPCVKVLATKSGSDYFDAINLGNIVCEMDGFFAEGGAKNIARRDGMGTTMLSAVTFIGRIPDYYFQAVGSGTGAIAAWEANLRFLEDGRYGDNKARIFVSQNLPFVPMYDAWKHDSREMLPYDTKQARIDANAVVAKVLTNRKPPYSIAGGLYDAMKDTDGEFFAVTNEEAEHAGKLFEELEGIDINPAAAVATASLIQAVENKQVENDAVIMLNITGGGEKRFKKNKELFFLKPERIFDVDANNDEIKEFVKTMY